MVEIYGIKYPITTSEDPVYVEMLAEEIDRSVRELLRGGGTLSVTQAMVLLNLNYLDASLKADETADRLREQVAEYLEESAKVGMELSEARAEIDRLKRELQDAKK